MVAGLRQQLNALGFSPFDIVLPDENAAVVPLPGALRLSLDAGRYSLATVDDGKPYGLGSADSSEAARQLVLGYVSRSLPAERTVRQVELDGLGDRAAAHYVALREDLSLAGPRGLVVDLPPDLALDRVGALDGVHAYAAGTPLDQRSLPTSVRRPENLLHRFVTRSGLRVRATFTPPGFGRPGGGIRFTLHQEQVGLRDLVVEKVLQRVRLAA
jgi:hypothetical protein